MIPWFEILGVPINCDKKALVKAYTKLCRTYHPDKARTGDAQRFELIQQAYTEALNFQTQVTERIDTNRSAAIQAQLRASRTTHDIPKFDDVAHQFTTNRSMYFPGDENQDNQELSPEQIRQHVQQEAQRRATTATIATNPFPRRLNEQNLNEVFNYNAMRRIDREVVPIKEIGAMGDHWEGSGLMAVSDQSLGLVDTSLGSMEPSATTSLFDDGSQQQYTADWEFGKLVMADKKQTADEEAEFLADVQLRLLTRGRVRPRERFREPERFPIPPSIEDIARLEGRQQRAQHSAQQRTPPGFPRPE